MKISLAWLRDYVEVEPDVAALADRLTIAGLEVANVRFFGLPVPEKLRVKVEEKGPVWDKDKIVTAQVVLIEKHPNADKLKIVTLDIGGGKTKQVVTGAPNIAVGDTGQKVILALTGSVLFDGHATPKKLVELKPTQLRGVPSDSMVCSAFELGIHDDHDGIILLEAEAPVGVPLMDFMADAVLEVDVLPNMARCLSLVGFAREVAALTGKTVCVPNPKLEPAPESVLAHVNVEIADASKSSRYQARIIRDITVGPSPGWMQRRLQYSGMAVINNAVDITNYVMMETGQPLHAFDYDVLLERAGTGKVPAISVRPAKIGEKMTTLDGVERELGPDNLVIADAVGAIALAGVMGGRDTEVRPTTKNILLEAAHFDFVTVRKTSRQFNIFNDAATRYSKGIHPELVDAASRRACELFAKHAGGKVLADAVDCYPVPPKAETVTLKKVDIKRLLGVEVPEEDVERILEALQFELVPDGITGWKVSVPPFRLDVQSGAADLIEEIARIRGYDKLPSTLLSGELPEQRNDRSLAFEDAVRDSLALGGLREVINYAMTTKAKEAGLLPAGSAYVELLNPISEERSVMRRSVLASVLDNAAANLRNRDSARLFEVGVAFEPLAGEPLPNERRRLAVVLVGRRGASAWDDPLGVKPTPVDFFDLKGVVESLLESLHVGARSYSVAKEVAWLHPGRSAHVAVAGKAVGVIGELHPTVAGSFGMAEKSVLVADIDLEVLFPLVPERFPFAPVPRFPAALRDVAVVVEDAVTNEAVEKEILAAGGELMKSARLFDVYKGDQVGPGRKSLAYALAYQSDDKVLGEKEIEKAHKKVEDRLRHVLTAQIRGRD